MHACNSCFSVAMTIVVLVIRIERMNPGTVDHMVSDDLLFPGSGITRGSSYINVHSRLFDWVCQFKSVGRTCYVD
jgi:hypothetical protein